MKEKRPHLGRGLEALLGPIVGQTETELNPPAESPAPTFPPDKVVQDSSLDVPIDKIKPNPFQPRTVWNDEELKSLSDSIKTNGLLQPILVRKTGDEYQIIAGERRYRAAKAAAPNRTYFSPAGNRSAMLELAF